jgi:quaternary ammonium compound-resistance protein SugE
MCGLRDRRLGGVRCRGAFMKAAGGFTRLWPSAAVIASFVVGAFFLTRAVQRSGLASAYTVGLGIEAIMVVTVGVGLLGERPSPTKVIGIVLILLGVAGVRLG